MIADDGFDPVETKGVSMSRYRQEAWWHAAIAAPDQTYHPNMGVFLSHLNNPRPRPEWAQLTPGCVSP